MHMDLRASMDLRSTRSSEGQPAHAASGEDGTTIMNVKT
jgi:hypothetical protein